MRVGPVGPVTRSECCTCLKNNPPQNYTNAKMGQHGRDRNSVLRLECIYKGPCVVVKLCTKMCKVETMLLVLDDSAYGELMRNAAA